MCGNSEDTKCYGFDIMLPRFAPLPFLPQPPGFIVVMTKVVMLAHMERGISVKKEYRKVEWPVIFPSELDHLAINNQNDISPLMI